MFDSRHTEWAPGQGGAGLVAWHGLKANNSETFEGRWKTLTLIMGG